MRRAAVAVTALAALPGAANARAATVPVALPSPVVPLSSEPPLAAVPVAVTEQRLPGPVDSVQTVVASLEPSGRARAVSVVQRLVVRGTGDYTFTVPAPVVDVTPDPGTQSQPGKRATEIIWQGFSSRRRVLAARATLRSDAAVPFLPLRISVSRTGGRVRVTIANATRASVPAPAGAASKSHLLRYMRELRRFIAGGAVPGTLVPVALRSERQADVVAPFRVRGTITLRGARIEAVRGGTARVDPAGRVAFTATVDRNPYELDLAGGAPAAPRLALFARPLMPRLSDPLPRDPRRALDAAVSASLEVARARQYATFIASPDPDGRRRASYVFRTVTAAPETRVTQPAGSGTPGSALQLFALVAMGIFGAAALIVAWAHL